MIPSTQTFRTLLTLLPIEVDDTSGQGVPPKILQIHLLPFVHLVLSFCGQKLFGTDDPKEATFNFNEKLKVNSKNSVKLSMSLPYNPKNPKKLVPFVQATYIQGKHLHHRQTERKMYALFVSM